MIYFDASVSIFWFCYSRNSKLSQSTSFFKLSCFLLACFYVFFYPFLRVDNFAGIFDYLSPSSYYSIAACISSVVSDMLTFDIRSLKSFLLASSSSACFSSRVYLTSSLVFSFLSCSFSISFFNFSSFLASSS